jgi:hypothetical protein
LPRAVHLELVAGSVETLCRLGADMSAASVDSNPPLWIALDSSQEDLASILVRLVKMLAKSWSGYIKDKEYCKSRFLGDIFFCIAYVMNIIC